LALLFLLALCAASQDAASLRGRAVDLAGKPVSKVHVRLSAALPDAASYGAMSADDGRFSIDRIVPGTYRLLVDHPVFYCQPPEESKPAGRLTFQPSQHLENLKLEMAPPAILSGRVLDENGQPVEVDWVQIELASDQASAGLLDGGVNTIAQMGKEAGEYRAGVPPGKYYIHLDGGSSGDELLPDGRMMARYFAETYYPSATSRKSATVVEAKAGQEIGGLDIHVEAKRPLSIAGIVTGGRPGAQAEVVVHKENSTTIVIGGDLETDPGIAVGADGSFLAKDLEPRNYSLSAASGTGAEKRRSTIQRTELTDTPVANLVLALVPPVKVTGTVQGPGAAGRTVRMEPASDNFLSQQYPPHAGPVARDGGFEIDGLEPEVFRLALAPMPEDGYIKSILPGGAAVEEWGVGEGELLPLVDLRHGSDVKLTVALGAGAGLSGKSAGGAVVLLPEGKKSLDDALIARPAADGAYKFHGLPPGKFRLLALDADRLDNRDVDLEELLGRAKMVELKEGEQKTEDLDGK
jgi:hypothetical protein